jgi:hypothetical protein
MAVLTRTPIATKQASRLAGLAPLFRQRETYGFGWMETVTLAVYTVILAVTLHFHEPWADEAQAWLIGRDNTVWQIIRYRQHYEGAPPLWALMLRGFHLLRGTYAGMGWLGAAIAVLGIYIWLRWSPFPLLLRVLVPFTFFLQYQFAVIARGYILFPLLIFSLCALYTRKQRVVWFAAAAGLLANISLQGFAVAFAIGVLYLFDMWSSSREDSGSEKAFAHTVEAPLRKRRVAALVLFVLMTSTAVYCAIPAPDLSFGIGDQVSTGTVHQILLYIVGETPRNAPKPLPDPAIVVPTIKHDLPDWHTAPRAWLAMVIYRPVDKSARHPKLRAILTTVGPNLLDFAQEATWPVANSNLLACAFLIALAYWFQTRGCLRMLAPWFALILAGQILWTTEHHAGMLFIALLAGMWLCLDTSAAHSHSPVVDRSLVALLSAVIVLQIAWSAHSIHADIEGSYDPGQETARWLLDHPKNNVAAFHFQTVSIQPWFSHSPFTNVPAAWWQWSSNIEVDGIHRTTIALHPDVVVFGIEFPGHGQMRDQWLPLTHFSKEEEMNLPRDPIVKDLHAHGYFETHRFCGSRFSRFSASDSICDIIFEPASR